MRVALLDNAHRFVEWTAVGADIDQSLEYLLQSRALTRLTLSSELELCIPSSGPCTHRVLLRVDCQPLEYTEVVLLHSLLAKCDRRRARYDAWWAKWRSGGDQRTTPHTRFE